MSISLFDHFIKSAKDGGKSVVDINFKTDNTVIDSFDINEDIINSYGEKYDKLSEGRALGGELLRADTLSEIHSGLNKIGNVIKIVTTLLSLFGGDNIDR